MKLILSVVICCLAFHMGRGAPRTAVYKFVRCNPEGDKANCVTQQSPEMQWSEDLPGKLPASTAQYLEAEPVEDESPQWEEEEESVLPEEGDMLEESDMLEEETPMMNQEGESYDYLVPEYGSGGYEGSAFEDINMADWPFPAAASETGSGESWMEKDEKPNRDGDMMRRLFPSRSLAGEAKPAEHELKEDGLLQLHTARP